MAVLVAGAAITLVLLVQHSKNFRQGILTWIGDGVQQATGARLEARDFSFRFSSLSLDVYNVVLRGTEADPNRPLLHADRLHVGLTIDSLLNRKWHVRDVILDRPVAHIVVSKAGENNLPRPPTNSSSTGTTNVFDLAVRKLQLDGGAIYYNDQKTPLDADLHGLAVKAYYLPAEHKYFGNLGYDNGKIVYGQYAPVEHSLQIRFGATSQKIVLEKAELSAGKSQVTLSASLSDYRSPNMRAEGSYEAVLVISDLVRILKSASLPGGTVRVAGQLSYQAAPKRPLLETVSMAGSVSSAGLAVETPALQTEVRDLFAHYTLSRGNLEVTDVHAQVMGGTLNGKLAIRDVAGASVARLQASVKDLSLDRAQTATHQSLGQAHLRGKISMDAEAHWSRTLANLMAHGDATLQGTLGQGPATPLNGVIHADYVAGDKQLALTNSYIRTPQTNLNLNGKVSDHSQLQVALHSKDLHEIEALAGALQKPAAGEESQSLGLYGAANVNATVSGSLDKPQISGQIEASNLRVKGSAWKVLRAGFRASPSQAVVSNGDLEAVPQGHISFSAQVSLRNWAYSPSNPVSANVSATQISLTDLERLVGKTYPVSGTLALNISVHGSQLNPVGQGSLTVMNAKVSSESVQNVHVKFQGDGNSIKANLTVQMPAGAARADVDYFPKDHSYRLQMQAPNIRLEKLQTVKARNLQIAGGLNLNASGRGTLKDPQLQATVEVAQLQLKKQTIHGIKLETTVENHVANISLDSNVARTFVRARGTVGVEAPYMADVHLDSGRIEFQPLVALYAPEQAADFSGETELHATLRGPLAEGSRVEVHLEAPDLTFNYKQVQLAAAKPVRVDYQNGIATLQPLSIRGTGTAIDAQAVVPVTTTDAASLKVHGNIDLQIAELLAPGLKSKGQIQFDIDSQQYGAGGNLHGKIKIVDANVHMADSPVGLDNGNGVINITQTRLEIASFKGEMGGGTINATGTVAYRPSVQFQLALTANNIRVRYPEGVRTILASNLALTGNPRQSRLNGQVRIQQVSFTPDFDLTRFAGQFSGESQDIGTPNPLGQGIKLDVAVQSTSQMNLSSSQLSLHGDANLRLVGTAALPVILGRANLTGGELFLAGNRYEVQHGTIGFANPVRTDPVLNLQVQTKINEYNIRIGVTGPVSHLQTTYTSDPALPPVDVINLIARGQTVESATTNQAPLGTLGAQAALATTVSNQVSSRLGGLAGVSQLQIDPGMGSNNGQNTAARVAVQQRVTSNLLVTFATDITSTQHQAIQVQYRLNQKWSIGGTRDQNGGFGMEGRYHKDF